MAQEQRAFIVDPGLSPLGMVWNRRREHGWRQENDAILARVLLAVHGYQQEWRDWYLRCRTERSARSAIEEEDNEPSQG